MKFFQDFLHFQMFCGIYYWFSGVYDVVVLTIYFGSKITFPPPKTNNKEKIFIRVGVNNVYRGVSIVFRYAKLTK